MLSSFVTAIALAASVSNVAAGPIRHASRGYAQDADILEDYTPYHIRYLALGCSGGHGSPFFEKCCHPLLRWQKLEDRPAECIPSPSASSSAVLAEPTATPIDEDPIPDYDDDCTNDEPTYSAAPAPVTSSTYIAPASTTPEPAPTTKSKASSTKEPEPEPTTTKPESTKEPEPTTTKKPESTKEPEPKPTSTKTTKSAEPEPTQGSGGGEVIKGGFATFYEQRGIAGACGAVHGDYEKIVALDYRRYGPIDQQSPDCGRYVHITNTKNGKSVTAMVADVCPTCINENCLDLSKGAFFEIATEEEGQASIEWSFL